MKKVAIIIGAFIFGIWGCSKDSMQDPINPDNRNADLKKSEVKTYVLHAVKLQNHVTATQGIYRVSGNMSHLGLIDPGSVLTIMPLGPDPDHPGYMLQSAAINMIGADGSGLHFKSTKAIFSLASGYGEQEWIIDQGTGRFEGATGWFKSTSQFDFVAGINYVTGSGEVYIAKK